MINDLILNIKTDSFLKFHSEKWVKELKEKVRKEARNDNDIDGAISRILWSSNRPTE